MITNQKLMTYGHNIQISRLSLKEQGLDREPLLHIGPAANYAERWGRKTARGNKLRGIQERNRLREEIARIHKEIDVAIRNKEKQPIRSFDVETRTAALANIGEIIRSKQHLNLADLEGLTLGDLEQIKELNVKEVHRRLRQSERYRDVGREK